MSKSFKNHEIVTIATYLVGGDTHEVDTEDIAMKVNEVAPGRFTWTKYKDQINIEIIRAFLSDAKKAKYGSLLVGTGTTGWMLTEAGAIFAANNAHYVNTPSSPTERLGLKETHRRAAEKARILASTAFNKFQEGQKNEITAPEIDSVFRLNQYIVEEARRKKVLRVLNAHGKDNDIGVAVQFFATVALGENGP